MSRQGIGALVLLFLVIVVPAWGYAQKQEVETESLPSIIAHKPTDSLYASYAEALQWVDDEGMVDYKGLKANRGPLDEYIDALGQVDPGDFNTWTTEEQVAFWVNAYNGITLREIIDHYPIKASFLKSLVYPKNSIRQIAGVWKKHRYSVVGKERTLQEIEHEVLRKQYRDPRIHVALVCAAMGCPPLLNEPYRSEVLDDRLAGRARLMFRHREKFRIDREEDVVHLSPIFKWFDDDFVDTYGTDQGFAGHSEKKRAVLNYVSEHVGDED